MLSNMKVMAMTLFCLKTLIVHGTEYRPLSVKGRCLCITNPCYSLFVFLVAKNDLRS